MPEKRKRSTWKRLLILLVILIITTGSAAAWLKYHYKDIVRELIKKELDNRLVVDIYTEIDFTVIKTFPYASVVFSNTYVMDPLQKDSVMLAAKQVYFKFNIMDLLRKNYTLNRIEISDGELKLYTNEDGDANFRHIMKPTPDSARVDMEIELNKVSLQDIAVHYMDRKNDHSFNAFAEKAFAKGRFDEQNFSLSAYGNMKLKKLVSKGNVWAVDDQVFADMVMLVNAEQKNLSISRGKLEFNSLPLELTGSLDFSEKQELDVRMKGSDLDMQQLLKDIPERFTEKLEPYKLSGSPYMNIHLKGSFADGRMPHIDSDFGLQGGNVKHKKSGISLENLNLKGTFTNGEQNSGNTMVLDITEYSGTFDEQPFSGAVRLRNINQPGIHLVSKSRLDLNKLREFAGLDTLEAASGMLDIDLSYAFKPTDIQNLKPTDFASGTAEGKIALSGVSLKLKESNLELHEANGTLAFNNRDVVIRELKAKINENSDFSLRGYLDNLLPFLLFKDQKLHLVADLSSNYLSLNELLKQEQSSDDETVYSLELPADISFDLDLDVKKCEFRKFRGENISGTAKLRNQVLLLDNIRFNGMGGNVAARGTLNASGPQIRISGNAYLKNVHIKQAIYQLENLGQDKITHENISGVLWSDFSFSASFTRELKPMHKTFKAEASLKITDGKLINYGPMQQLAGFLKVDDLSQVEFGTLENDISVNHGVIVIPQMEINSTAANIKLAGQHTFNNEIDYHLEILLSEILSGKARANKKENSEFGRIEDDGLGRTRLFLKVFGTMENPKFAYDTQELKKKIKKDIKEEKTELKQIMHEELGLFRNDSTVKQKPKTERQIEREKKKKEKEKQKQLLEEREKGKFIIEWEED